MKKVSYLTAAVIAVAAVVWVWAAPAGAQDRNRARGDAPLITVFGPGSSLGITVRDSDAGVVIEDVGSETPASRAGLRQGDVVTEFDGERTRSAAQFTRLVRETPPGRTVKMTVRREGSSRTMEITPETRRAGDIRLPDIAGDLRSFQIGPRDFTFDFGDGLIVSPRRLGATVTPMSDQLAAYFGVKQGILVTEVASGSPAEAAGMKAGDVILSVGGRDVSSPEDVAREIREAQPGASVDLRVMRDRKEMALTAKLPERQRQARPFVGGSRPI
jgi:S1-C subfamily serine protease